MAVLLERERELGELTGALGEVGEGKGCLLAVEAAAGLGKTRLLQEAREAAEGAGLSVLSGRATELETDFPFALVRQLFESELDSLPADQRDQALEGASAARGALGLDADGRPDQDTFAVLHGLYWVTAALAERKPLLLAIDDTHCADSASLDYLGFLLPRLEELPVLLVVTGRPDEPDRSGGFRRVMTDTAARHMTLAPLSAEGAAVLLGQELDGEPSPPFAAACFEVSGGNPFLLRELARTLLQRGIEPLPQHADQVRELVPERVAQTVLPRIERLPPQAGALARALAVLGDASDPRLVAELAGIDADQARHAADELRASAIFDPDSSLRFIHPLMRNAVYADIPSGERGQAHASAAVLLRGRRAGLEEIATQLLASEGRGDRATTEALIEAGKRALATGAPHSAVAYLNRALQEPPPDDLRAVVLAPMITAVSRAADHEAWAAIEPEVLAELDREPSLRLEWAGQLTLVMAMGGRFEEAAALLVEAVDVAVGEDDVHRAFQLESQLNTLAQMVPSLPQVDLTRHADRIDSDSSSGRLAAAIEARAALVDGSAREAVDAAGRALADDGAIFAEEPELAAADIVVMTLVAADEVDAARRAAVQALGIGREHGATPMIARGFFLRGFAAWGSGDLISAEADMRQAIDLVRMAGIPPLVVLYTGLFVEILIERDQLDEAEGGLRLLGVAEGPIPLNPMFSSFLLTRGHLRFERGELEAALEDFEALQRLTDLMGPGPVMSACPQTVRAMVATGERERALELAEEMLVFARRWGAPGSVSHLLRARATAQGGKEGIETLEEAATMLEDSPRLIERLHALTDLGEALRHEGRRAEARAPLREALQLARRCGAMRIAKRAHEELSATGETVRRYTPVGVESLTPSERRVAELAASGMTNRQIAQSLFVTVKTVEAHLSATYDKLDIASRRQLPAALGEPN
ncbi:MAG TPA: AAA family ATPase [Solirubrobacterales bacterium]